MFDLTDNYNSIESLPSIYVYYYVFFGRYLRNKMKNNKGFNSCVSHRNNGEYKTFLFKVKRRLITITKSYNVILSCSNKMKDQHCSKISLE